MEIIHCADLHLSNEAEQRDYSLAVFQEIVAHADRCDLLIIAGDLFNTFTDAEILLPEVRKRLEHLSTRVVCIPGNHEELEAGRKSLGALDSGKLHLATDRPFSFHRLEQLELICIPHTTEDLDYDRWSVPTKEHPRIVIAHGIVSGMTYTGPDEEGGAAAMNPGLFSALEADYAALGHVHARRVETHGNTILAYPGSARVWRRGESGARGVLKIKTTGDGIHPPEFLELESAGQYRQISLNVGLDGTIDLPEPSSFSTQDYVHLRLAGIVEDERELSQRLREAEARFAEHVRRLKIDRTGVTALPGIASEPLAKGFLERLDSLPMRTEDPELYQKTRELGLREIKQYVEAK